LLALKDPKVWKLCQYYSIVFGGYVAMSLWMVQYYVGEFGLDITTAALLAACFSLPGGVLRAVGGWFSDRYGAHAVTWWVLWLSWICLFLLSYPQTDFTIMTVNGPRSFHIGLNVYLFTALVFLLGIGWAFGKASVFKYISDEYPRNIGVISGVVGLAGGLGGFVLPIMFGAMMDLTGIRSSAFMLMYGVVWVSLIWMYLTEVRGTHILGADTPALVKLHTPHLVIHRSPYAKHQSLPRPCAPVRPTSPTGDPRTTPSGRAPARRSPTATSGSRCRRCSAALRSGACGASSPCRCSTSGSRSRQPELFTLTAIAGISGRDDAHSGVVPDPPGRRGATPSS
jgi:MFS family permease